MCSVQLSVGKCPQAVCRKTQHKNHGHRRQLGQHIMKTKPIDACVHNSSIYKHTDHHYHQEFGDYNMMMLVAAESVPIVQNVINRYPQHVTDY